MSRSGTILPPPIPSRGGDNGDTIADLACPGCGAAARIPVRFAGKRVRCPSCAAEFRVAEDASRLIGRVARQSVPPALPRRVATTETPPPGSPRRAWLWTAWAAGLLATGVVAFLLLTNGDRDSDSRVEEIVLDSQPIDAIPPKANANAAAERQAGVKQNAANDPPKPVERDGDRLVQIDKFDEQRLQGMQVATPAAALKRNASLDSNGAPLLTVLKQIAERHRIAIVVDSKALDDEGIPLKTWPVTVAVKDVPLSEAFEAVLGPIQLTMLLPGPNAQAVVVTSEVKAAGVDANTLLKDGTLIAGQSPPAAKPAATSPAEKKSRPRKKKRKASAKKSPQALVRSGRRLLAQRKLDEAIAAFNQALKTRRFQVDALYNRGYAYLLKNENRKAVADFSEVIRLRRTNAAAYSARAVAYIRLGKRESARADRIIAVRLRRRKK